MNAVCGVVGGVACDAGGGDLLYDAEMSGQTSGWHMDLQRQKIHHI